MAETSDSHPQPDINGTSDIRARRRLRDAPETIRQRTAKLQHARQPSAGTKNGAARSFWRGFTWPLRRTGRLLGRFGRYKVVRIIGRIIVPRYFRNSWRELRLVTWPGRRQTWKLTYAVIIFSLIFGAIVAVVDFGLDKLFKEFIIK